MPLSTGSTQSEIEYFLKDSEASIVFCSPKYAEMLAGIPDCPKVVEVTHEDLIEGNKAQLNPSRVC